MAKSDVQDIRNIVFCGHGSAGKTTLADAILNATGTIKRPASVNDGTSICDFDEEEKTHHHSIESTLVHFEHAGKHFNLIDTPGYPDFIAQVIGALHAVETAVIVIDAHSGLGVNTRRVFKEAGDRALGRIIIINKMDTDNVDYPALLATIGELFGKVCVPLNVPIGHGADFKGVASTLKPPEKAEGAIVDPASIHESLIESIIEVDDGVTERYFEGKSPTDEELARLIGESIAAGSLIPVLCVSAKTGVGLTELLDALAACALPPDAIQRTATKDGDEVTIKADAGGPLVAQVFKTRIDPFVQKLSFIRLFSGSLKKDQSVAATGARKPVKIGPLLEMQANETSPVDSAGPGDIVAVAKMEELTTGAMLGDLELPPMVFPTPMVGLAVTPKSRGDEAKLSGAIHKIVEEDPTFSIHRDPQTKEMVMTGMSELHLQIVQERLKRRDKVEVETKLPKIPYRETIQSKAEGSYRHKKQSGGRGQFGEVHIHMLPFPEGTDAEEFCTKARFPSMKTYHLDEANNFVWVDSVVSATIPGNFMPAVGKGFAERLAKGVVAGFQVQNVCINVHFGKHHPVDSSEAAFKTAASMVFRNVFQEARPAMLEPIVHLHVTVPSAKVGDVNSDLSSRRGRPIGLESAGGDLQTVSAEVPLAEVTTYARSLSSMTGGQGSYALEFSHYDVVPPNVQQEIIAKAKMKEEEDD
ncbi:MAG: elongation factor G [Planctomycetes bacterium]|nr:elongation factor G [Planctomycetota bacterium]